MRKIKNHIFRAIKHVSYLGRPLNVPVEFIHKDVPYFSQWESSELNNQILDKSVKAQDDPKWRESGAKTKQEYTAWSWSGCGMACTKMLLAKINGKTYPLVVLGKKCASYGGYTYPLEQSNGLLYKPYVSFLKEEFKIKATVKPHLLIREVIEELAKGSFVIASVSPQIRQPNAKPTVKGGHLILMLGYSLTKKEFYLHNPSGLYPSSQSYTPVKFNDFKKFFSNKGIVVQTLT